MATQDQTPTQDQVVQAGICVYDYVLNPAVRGEFNRVLAAAKASPDDGETILQDFFDRRQYATTPGAFKQVFSDYAKNPITLSPQATRFAIDFAANSVLRLDWYDAARQMAAAQPAINSAAAPAGAQPAALAAFNDVLQRNGYTGVTADQATLAQTRLLASDIGAWTGIYSKTTIFNQQVDSKDGPKLIIDASEDPATVTLDKKHIVGYKFDPDTNTLSWTKEGTGTFPNDTAAKLYFSRDDGPSFTGTLDNSNGSFSYFGLADQSGGSGGGTGGSGSGESGLGRSDWIAIGSAIASGLVGIAGLIATAVGTHAQRQSPTQRNLEAQVDRVVTKLANLETTSKISPNDFVNLVSDPQIQAAVAQVIALRQAPPAQQGELERRLNESEESIRAKRNAVELEVTESVMEDIRGIPDY
jgi:hypothetical protein